MVGVPIRVMLTAAVGADPPAPPPCTASMPAAAAPPAPSTIHAHLCPPCPPEFRMACELSSALLKVSEQTVPARKAPFAAVMRTSNDPAIRFHCMPQALTLPSGWLVATSVFEPLANVPLGPCSGRRKATVAPSTGLPKSSEI